MEALRQSTDNVPNIVFLDATEEKEPLSGAELSAQWSQVISGLEDWRPSQDDLWETAQRSVREMFGPDKAWRITSITFEEPEGLGEFMQGVAKIDEAAKSVILKVDQLLNLDAPSEEDVTPVAEALKGFTELSQTLLGENASVDPVANTDMTLWIEPGLTAGLGIAERLGAKVKSVAELTSMWGAGRIMEAELKIMHAFLSQFGI